MTPSTTLPSHTAAVDEDLELLTARTPEIRSEADTIG
jgi:hypothetical protein